MSGPLRVTSQQQKALDESAGAPVYLCDDSGRESVVLLDADRFRAMVGDAFDISETYPAQQQALSSVWSAPELDEYTSEDGSPID